MFTLTREDLKQVIKEAIREALAESGPPKREPEVHRKAPPILTLEQVAAIEGKHIVMIRNWARLGKIPGAEKRGGEWCVKCEKDSGNARHVANFSTPKRTVFQLLFPDFSPTNESAGGKIFSDGNEVFGITSILNVVHAAP